MIDSAPVELNSSDHAYLTLRERILQGEIPPGAVLKERDLCEQLNISRTPIREALRRLCADGLAEARPRRSIIVSAFDDQEMAEIFELGSSLKVSWRRSRPQRLARTMSTGSMPSSPTWKHCSAMAPTLQRTAS
jgi:DNA-binding FadR family transcriptional regulator